MGVDFRHEVGYSKCMEKVFGVYNRSEYETETLERMFRNREDAETYAKSMNEGLSDNRRDWYDVEEIEVY